MLKDGLRLARFEWIFGVPQVVVKKNHQRKFIEIGLDAIDFVNNEAYHFKSGVIKGAGDALLTDIFKAQKTRVEMTIYSMHEIISMCIEDEEICDYIYHMPAPTHQYTRYCDWFEPFCLEQRVHLIEQSQRFQNFNMQDRENINLLTSILSMLPTFKEKCAKFDAKWKKEKSEAKADDFEGYKNVNMVGQNDEVLDHWPPQYIVGPPVEELSTECYVEETDLVTVRMFKMTAEYIWSNPTGKFNLSIPDKKLKNHLNFRAPELSYAKWKKSQTSGESAEFSNGNDDINIDEETIFNNNEMAKN